MLAVIVFGVAVRLRMAGTPLGDEPHYLALAQAIVKYHTFDPTQVYANRDYWSYYPSEIDAHVAVVDGRAVPFHNIGAPLLFALPFLLWGRAGAQLVTLIAAVLIIVNMYRLQRELGITTAWAGFVTAAFALGSPLYVYASMLFVEPIGMLIVIYAVRVLLTRSPALWRVLLASAAVGYLPWVHGRYAIFPVTFAALFAIGRRWRAYLVAVAPMAVLAIGLEVFNFVMFRSLSPAPGSTDALGEGLLRLSPDRGLLYLAFDARFGLLPNFPLLILAFAGALLVGRRVNLVLLGTMVPYAVVLAGRLHPAGAAAGRHHPAAGVLRRGAAAAAARLADDRRRRGADRLRLRAVAAVRHLPGRAVPLADGPGQRPAGSHGRAHRRAGRRPGTAGQPRQRAHRRGRTGHARVGSRRGAGDAGAVAVSASSRQAAGAGPASPAAARRRRIRPAGTLRGTAGR